MELKSLAGLLMLPLGLMTPGTAQASDPIPTEVVGPDDDPEYPDPICTTCGVRTVETSNANNTDEARIGVHYVESEPFEGDLLVTVWLDSGETADLVISDVRMEDGYSYEYDQASGPDWQWIEARLVWLEFMPIS
ncbi:MAG: hypothetical protein AAF799_01570 [Myxococcota bacterium]